MAGGSPQKHLTGQGWQVGAPICGAPAAEKLHGSMHAAYYEPERDGTDFCPFCLELLCDACPDVADSYELVRLTELGRIR